MGQIIEFNKGRLTGCVRRYCYKDITYIISSSFTPLVKNPDASYSMKKRFESALLLDIMLTENPEQSTITSAHSPLSAGKESYADKE